LQILLIVAVAETPVGVDAALREQLLIEEVAPRQLDISEQPLVAIPASRPFIEIDAHLPVQRQTPGQSRGLFGEVHPLAAAAAHFRRIDPQ
jgi:hypothetical protein